MKSSPTNLVSTKLSTNGAGAIAPWLVFVRLNYLRLFPLLILLPTKTVIFLWGGYSTSLVCGAITFALFLPVGLLRLHSSFIGCFCFRLSSAKPERV